LNSSADLQFAVSPNCIRQGIRREHDCGLQIRETAARKIAAVQNFRCAILDGGFLPKAATQARIACIPVLARLPLLGLGLKFPG